MLKIILPSLILALICPQYACFGAELSATDEQGTEVLTGLIDPVCGFKIRYTHSVALTPVEDYFLARDGKIILDKTIYQDFGAGLPHEPGPGKKMKFGDGKVEIAGYDTKMPEFTLRVGRVANHHLIFFTSGQNGGCVQREDIPLAEKARGGSAITFRIK